MKTVLTNCNVIDCTGNELRKDMTVVIEGETIVDVHSGPPCKESVDNDRVFDLDQGYVLPGLWNVHVHLGDLIPDPKHLLESESPIDYAIRAGRNAMNGLLAGVTSIRTVGEDYYADVAWKRAFRDGAFIGPRMFVCGKAISATGGHGHGTLGAVEIDGPFEMRKMVREQLKCGADQIKLMVTGGIMTEGEGMQESQLLPDEIEAATVIAHQKGKRVAVHAWGTEGVKAALRGGVDCIEHGLLDDEAIRLLLEHDAFYVPTLRCTQDERMSDGGMPQFMIEKALGAARTHQDGFRRALEDGVKIACGSDTGPVDDFTHSEIMNLVEAGMTEMQALIAATQTSADLCGVADRVGTIETGKLADLIVVPANPLESISNLRMLKMVFKGGSLVHEGKRAG